MANNSTVQDEAVTLDDGSARIPCFDPSCAKDATNRCYDSNVDQEVAFCDDHVDEWLENAHITKTDTA
ncbi:hypothetical protein [Haloarcula amylovorans]|uniref:hypothetical protein n=1 Tax=Haloarcula amylovorans TaxID=2562280 RepID=UPI0010765DAF|nr:hypothetical protein [Halomicroarcula amylolytica]